MTPVQSICLNCRRPLVAGHPFCGQCGQKASTRRMTMHDIGHDLVHAFTHADHSVFSLVRALATRPGKVAREYVDGRRKLYFNPFTFLIIVVGVAVVLMAVTKFDLATFSGGLKNPISAFLQRNINLIILAQVPLLALFGAVLFREDKLNFAEHLVLTTYTSGFRSIFFMLAVIPVWAIFSPPFVSLTAVYIAMWVAYFGVACAQFYTGNRWWLWFKGVLVAVLAQAVTTATIAASISVYFKYFRKASGS
jgi:hypothetical protein